MPRVKWSTVRLTKWPSTIGIRFVIRLHSLPVGWLQGQGAHITTVSWLCGIMTRFWHEVTIITTMTAGPITSDFHTLRPFPPVPSTLNEPRFSYNTIAFHGPHWSCYKGVLLCVCVSIYIYIYNIHIYNIYTVGTPYNTAPYITGSNIARLGHGSQNSWSQLWIPIVKSATVRVIFTSIHGSSDIYLGTQWKQWHDSPWSYRSDVIVTFLWYGTIGIIWHRDNQSTAKKV